MECYILCTYTPKYFQIGDKNLGPIQITLAHDGGDGLQLEWVDVDTDERRVRCQVNRNEVDDKEWLRVSCG